MRVERIIADVPVGDIEAARDFYVAFLGMQDEDLGLDWVARLVDPSTGAAVQLVTRDATAAVTPAISVLVDDVDAAYTAAQAHGYEIVHPLATEAWGVRRFLVRAPDGTVVNVVRHGDC